MITVLEHDTEKPRKRQFHEFFTEEEALKFAIRENYETWSCLRDRIRSDVRETDIVDLPLVIRDIFTDWMNQKRGPERLPLDELTLQELKKVNNFVEDLVCTRRRYFEVLYGFFDTEGSGDY